MQTHDDWLNAKIAECEEKEQRAIAILDKTPARRPQRTPEERAKTEAFCTIGGNKHA